MPKDSVTEAYVRRPEKINSNLRHGDRGIARRRGKETRTSSPFSGHFKAIVCLCRPAPQECNVKVAARISEIVIISAEKRGLFFRRECDKDIVVPHRHIA
jgi:hypothetical protein